MSKLKIVSPAFKFYLGDCLEVMKKIPDNTVDMVLCDLPYGVTQNKSDIVIPFEPLWEQYSRIVKKNGAIVLFAQGVFFIDLVNSNRKMFKYELIWDKVLTSNFLNANIMPLRRHEQVVIFCDGKTTYNPQMTHGFPNHSKGKPKVTNNNNYGKHGFTQSKEDGLKYPTSIVTFTKPHPSVTKHRTEKSVELCEWLIRTYSNEGDIVLDNCMGSGTTGVACKHTNRKFIGIELEKEYFDIAQERVKNE